MGAQDDDKKVWFETASFRQLLQYFLKFATTIWIIGFASGIVASLIGFYTNWYTILIILVVNWHLSNPLIFIVYLFGLACTVLILRHERKRKVIKNVGN